MLSALANKANYRCDVHFMEAVLEMFIDHEIQPNKRVIDRLEEFKRKCLKIVAEKVRILY
jgi:hypothetical protein